MNSRYKMSKHVKRSITGHLFGDSLKRAILKVTRRIQPVWTLHGEAIACAIVGSLMVLCIILGFWFSIE